MSAYPFGPTNLTINYALLTPFKFSTILCNQFNLTELGLINDIPCTSGCLTNQDGWCNWWSYPPRIYRSPEEIIKLDEVGSKAQIVNFVTVLSRMGDVNISFGGEFGDLLIGSGGSGSNSNSNTRKMGFFWGAGGEVGDGTGSYYNRTQAIFGLAYSFLNGSFEKDILEQLVGGGSNGEKIFAFDFFLVNATVRQNSEIYDLWIQEAGKMIFGGGLSEIQSYALTEFGQEISWAQKDLSLNTERVEQYYEGDSLYTTRIGDFLVYSPYDPANTIAFSFPMYKVSICDSPLHHYYSESWVAVINTEVEGIAMPFEFFQGVSQWIDWDGVRNGSVTMPSISFQLNDDPDAQVFWIPLENMWDNYTILANDEHVERFHLSDLAEIEEYYDMYYDGRPYLQIGVRALQHLFAVVDMDEMRIGLVQKANISAEMQTGGCALRKPCGEYQYFSVSQNDCFDPPCSQYVFQMANKEGACTYNYIYVAFAVFLVLLCVIADCALSEIYACFVRTSLSKHSANPVL